MEEKRKLIEAIEEILPTASWDVLEFIFYYLIS